MILIIQIQNIPFHYFEFVKPIEDIILESGFSFKSVHYQRLTKHLIKNSEMIIISGTSLKDNTYLHDKEKFTWITTYQRPALGICGGMQLLALSFDEQILKGKEIGLHSIIYKNEFLGENGKREVYALHNNYIKLKTFETFAQSDLYPQAIKHPEKPLYGVLFHPEVRNKQMIKYFIENSKR
jgi:GMP synthase (glutamine-hydrolysing)